MAAQVTAPLPRAQEGEHVARELPVEILGLTNLGVLEDGAVEEDKVGQPEAAISEVSSEWSEEDREVDEVAQPEVSSAPSASGVCM